MKNRSEKSISHQEVIAYYVECENAYKDAWGLDRNMQLNLGLWKKGTKSLSQAMEQLNREIADKAGVTAGTKVLDAGCGVGGTTIYLARNYGCNTYGIGVVPRQINQAIENARMNHVSHLAQYEVMDFCNTSYPDDFFDVIIGIESICHADSKLEFLQEAYRILKPGGRLILAENLQAKENLSPREYDQLYTKAFNGCKINSLDTAQDYLRNLELVGYHSYKHLDYTDLIRPSIRRLRRFYYPAFLYNQYRALIGKPFSPTKLANTRMCYYLQTALKNGLWSYGFIQAVK